MESKVVLDSSAIVAMLMGEASAGTLLERLRAYPVRIVPSPTFLEVVMVLGGRKKRSLEEIRKFLTAFEIVIAPFDEIHAEASAEAFRRFGRGSHAAKLNFGDCMAYAVAKVGELPLLFVGDDFSKTDIEAA